MNIFQSNGVPNGKNIVLEPSPVKSVVKKVVSSLICAFIFLKFSTIYPVKLLKGFFFQKINIFQKMLDNFSFFRGCIF